MYKHAYYEILQRGGWYDLNLFPGSQRLQGLHKESKVLKIFTN